MNKFFLRAIACIACLAAVWPAAAAARRITLGDLARLNDVRDPQFSPDGRSIAFVVVRPNFRTARYDTQLVAVDLAMRRQRVLQSKLGDISFARWSSDGKRIAFIADVDASGDKAAQVFVMPAAGGKAHQITHAPNDVEQIAWRPRAQELAYVTADEAKNKEAVRNHDDAFVVGDNDYRALSAPTPLHLWMVSADGRHNRRLTSGAHGLTSMDPPYTLASPISWSPDGSTIIFARLPGAYQDEALDQDVRLVDAASGAVRKPISGKYQMMPAFSPDGSRLSYAYPKDGDYNQVGEIHVAPAAGGRGTVVTRALDRNVLLAQWMPDGALLIGADDGTKTALWRQPLGAAARRLDTGEANWTSATVSSRGAVAFSGTSARRPPELFYMRSAGARPERLTNVNSYVASLDLGTSTTIEWQGPDGFREDGVLTYPPGYAAGRKYPLVLLVHGGPIANSNTGFNELTQLLGAQGYLVFEPNYRGSDNAGNAFERAIAGDAGDGPGRDVMSGVAAVEKTGVVDVSRIAVSGWSYGGFMTSWLIGHYHIWKADVSGAAVNDWQDDYALADDRVSDRLQLGSSPWTPDQAERWRRQSPITYAAQITTPTLIMCDTGDVRVPIPESYKMFLALRDLHVPVEFVAYPVSGHLPADPVRNADIDRRWVRWLHKYLH
ncbi:MAG: S9 family peptidase [Candidatus Eremiobacteraeota bacterium]|nr:S9 family peptidase [Candidatus Eremiobacteraeota bacterium]